MRKLALFTGAMLVVMLAVAGGFSTPDAARAACLCWDYNSESTGTNWGMGADCSVAYDDLVSKLNQEAWAYCGGITNTCLGDVVLHGDCHFKNGMWIRDGHRLFSCKVCGPITP